MKYRVDFPIPLNCNLQCYYCFHSAYFKREHPWDKNTYDRGFTLYQWCKWRDTFLINAKEIWLNLHGGEPFHNENIKDVLHIISYHGNTKETYDLLSNGLCSTYNEIEPFTEKIKRIGFTYHRAMIQDNEPLNKKFINNVLFVRDLGISVYIKELLRVKDRKLIIENKKWWKDEHGIQLKVQDYKGDYLGADFSEYSKYSGLDYQLVDNEYKHSYKTHCTCFSGYRCFGIRGFDEFAGNIVACWQDPVIVGNIQDMWFNPNWKVSRIPNSDQRNVIGVPKKYAGTNERDRPTIPDHCKN